MKAKECKTTDLTGPPIWVAFIRGERVAEGMTLDEARGLAVMEGHPVDQLVYRCERRMPEK